MDRWNKTHCDRCGEKVGQGEGIYAMEGFYHKDDCYKKEKQKHIDNYDWDEFDTAFEREMICPYCGQEESDPQEYPDDDGTVQCGRCEKEFEYTRDVEVTYSTTPINEE